MNIGVFVDQCSSFYPFSFVHCIICHSWKYDFWLLLLEVRAICLQMRLWNICTCILYIFMLLFSKICLELPTIQD